VILCWLQYLQAFALVAIPPIGAWLAWQQVQIARVKLQHDLYDRRYQVFDATRRLLANVCATGYASDEAQRAFMLGDAIACPAQLEDSEWAAMSDIDWGAREAAATLVVASTAAVTRNDGGVQSGQDQPGGEREEEDALIEADAGPRPASANGAPAFARVPINMRASSAHPKR